MKNYKITRSISKFGKWLKLYTSNNTPRILYVSSAYIKSFIILFIVIYFRVFRVFRG